MKSIYDEAIEEVKKIWNGNELTYPKKTIEALERAKKVEELLGLYQKVRKQVEEYVDTPNKKPKVLHLALDIHDTLNDIDELEKELEEMK